MDRQRAAPRGRGASRRAGPRATTGPDAPHGVAGALTILPLPYSVILPTPYPHPTHTLTSALTPTLTLTQEERRKLLVLCQRVRRETDDAKVLVFCQTEPQALRAAERLRRALWGIHNVVVRTSFLCIPPAKLRPQPRGSHFHACLPSFQNLAPLHRPLHPPWVRVREG